MTQPARRKSSLAGASPVMPAQAAEPIEEPRSRQAAPSKPKPKITIYQDAEDTARLRAAYRHTFAESNDRSFSDFVVRILMAEVERIEAEYNGGKPFEGVEPGRLARGRPLGE